MTRQEITDWKLTKAGLECKAIERARIPVDGIHATLDERTINIFHPKKRSSHTRTLHKKPVPT
jgi:hypothetical protein